MRQRRNKTSTATLLEAKPQRRRKGEAPQLPPRFLDEDGDGSACWDPRTLEFWQDLWRSPMATEYLDADIHGLYILAELVERFWRKPSFTLAAEIRQQRQCFGLTPIDRRRLQWEVARVESTKRPRNRDPEPKTSSRRRIAGDPRSVLKVVS